MPTKKTKTVKTTEVKQVRVVKPTAEPVAVRQLSDVEKFYIQGNNSLNADVIAATLGVDESLVAEHLKTLEPAPLHSPALDLLGRGTGGDAKIKGVTVMTGGASEAGDDARKAFRTYSDASGEDPSYVHRFKRPAAVTAPVTR